MHLTLLQELHPEVALKLLFQGNSCIVDPDFLLEECMTIISLISLAAVIWSGT